MQGLPQLLDDGILQHDFAQGISSYLVISPRGQLLGDDTEPELVHAVFNDIASTISKLHDMKILHRCDSYYYQVKIPLR